MSSSLCLQEPDDARKRVRPERLYLLHTPCNVDYIYTRALDGPRLSFPSM